MARRFDILLFMMLIAGAFIIAGRAWIRDHTQHVPWAPLELAHPWGWATGTKISDIHSDTAECRMFLERSAIEFTALEPLGTAECRRADRLKLASDPPSGLALSPATAEATCPVHSGLALWLRHGVQPAAEATLGSRVVRMEYLGTFACRRIGGGETGRWSQHATGNAIDISALILEDGRRISVLRDWDGQDERADFLRQIRDSACDIFATVLSPDYNAAHADHFHLDQQDGRTWGFCR